MLARLQMGRGRGQAEVLIGMMAKEGGAAHSTAQLGDQQGRCEAVLAVRQAAAENWGSIQGGRGVGF